MQPTIFLNTSKNKMISVNEYFDGKVKSIGYTSGDGKSTIGVMEPGEYEFNTSAHEIMQVIQGELIVQFPTKDEWLSFKSGASFEVEANSSFKVKAIGQTAYLCQYS